MFLFEQTKDLYQLIFILKAWLKCLLRQLLLLKCRQCFLSILRVFPLKWRSFVFYLIWTKWWTCEKNRLGLGVGGAKQKKISVKDAWTFFTETLNMKRNKNTSHPCFHWRQYTYIIKKNTDNILLWRFRMIHIYCQVYNVNFSFFLEI